MSGSQERGIGIEKGVADPYRQQGRRIPSCKLGRRNVAYEDPSLLHPDDRRDDTASLGRPAFQCEDLDSRGAHSLRGEAIGIAGAEGSVWLLIEGEKAQVEKALEIVEECRELEAGALF